jgi:hypothetical protein
MHKVQADYVKARQEHVFICVLDEELKRGIVPDADKQSRESTIGKLRADADESLSKSVNKLLEWASLQSAAIAYGIDVFVRTEGGDEKSRDYQKEFLLKLCEMALTIPVVTRGETD